MGVAEILKPAGEGAEPSPDRTGPCPRCGESAAPLAPVAPLCLDRASVVRCHRCGIRHVRGPGEPRFVFTCDRCGLPFVADALLPHQDHRCSPCRQGEPVADLPSPAESAATEAEVLDGIGARWRFVSSPGPATYVGHLVSCIAGRMDPKLASCRVVFLDDPSVKTLALPAGTLLVSRGAIAAVEDEAELVFLLAHEVAHAATGDAAVLLGRMGFRATARHGAREDGRGWADAASDLVVLGYGRRRERDADARAVEVMLALGYDPQSALRFLSRVDTNVRAGDASLAAYAASHPPPSDRMRRVERAMYGRVATGAGKVNREVFRRVAWTAAWSPTRTPAPTRSRGLGSTDTIGRASGRSRVWIAVGIIGGLVLAAAVVAVLLG